ncbi:MAG TPA: DNA polymerase ligase N-terminal domain-containing protein [candidate division Zixibacteria bacterium]|nr:DNA ligase [candidate division Zixibacteria bacterium]MDD4917251.1 DNA polymerase ligase N-terminal domain-containing protein [candidate division Zixibacteria bacterium]MDM7973453.1 DNA polymerase ligase N-terminal domain-containing protein [candidate division Zixibacteria bacterium]HOD67486.1 DNA polymerase ligase N-terminal domain-containing protein [candidate division Zixibacteria bacterium]HOZ09083.1 DNA polymerase ligase N-terminal domain-containing protein [candidate division Zixibacte
MTDDKLKAYREKRDFRKTAEPSGGPAAGRGQPLFVIQKHRASHLHFDFRLEIDGVLKSWAVPKGPSANPSDKRLAVETEDHPIEYADFEGTIPEGEYGGGTVMIWDAGRYANLTQDREGGEIPLAEAYARGAIEIELHGARLRGGYALRRFKKERDRGQWLLIKMRDAHADPDRDPVAEHATSVKTGRTMEEIEHAEGGGEG